MERDYILANSPLLIFISTHTLRVERDSDAQLKELEMKISTHTLRVERDVWWNDAPRGIFRFQLTRSVWSVTLFGGFLGAVRLFQLTRSVWSVTLGTSQSFHLLAISTHTLRVERDRPCTADAPMYLPISTHTLRVERDAGITAFKNLSNNFNSHAPCGAWLAKDVQEKSFTEISTHTLRVERDKKFYFEIDEIFDFNSHAPCGAWPYILYISTSYLL